jgi:integrase
MLSPQIGPAIEDVPASGRAFAGVSGKPSPLPAKGSVPAGGPPPCSVVDNGLRVSELIGLWWEEIHSDSLTIDERYCRGDWSVTKTPGSAATIGVAPDVTERIQGLRSLEVELNWGGKGAKRRIKVVRSSGPHDLVFQSLRNGGTMNDQNIVRRHLRPAAEKLKMDPKKATWRPLRTSRATWMIEAGVDPKSVQASMRRSRISTTMDIYAQFVPRIATTSIGADDRNGERALRTG